MKRNEDSEIIFLCEGQEILKGSSIPISSTPIISVDEKQTYDIEVRFNDIDSGDVMTLMRKLSGFVDKNKSILSEVEVD